MWSVTYADGTQALAYQKDENVEIVDNSGSLDKYGRSKTESALIQVISQTGCEVIMLMSV